MRYAITLTVHTWALRGERRLARHATPSMADRADGAGGSAAGGVGGDR